MRRIVVNPPVAIGALIIIGILLVFGGIWPDTAGRFFEDVQRWVLDTFGWFYILAVALFLIFAIVLAFSRFGRLKLGPDDSTPDYAFVTWLAMLFAAGMGIGLMYFAVAEPIQHFSSPPDAEPRSVQAQRDALVLTFFHYGVHPWAVYGLVGLSLGYFGYRYNLPLTIRSGLYPLLKDRINGPIGHGVDIFAICSTIFGVATSLGFGVLQINAGLNYLFDIPEGVGVQTILIFSVMAVATVSVVLGLDVGIRRLSELNLSVAIALMVFVLVVSSTIHLLSSFVQNVGNYLGTIVPRSFTTYAYQPNEWIDDWTIFYWAWWISWSPFVGMFIARISRGRTVREFLLGVLLVPATFTFFWMTVFGNSAISIDTGEARGALAAAVDANVNVALFQFFEYLPGTAITSGLAILLVAVFFVTSADSGSLVVDTLASGGRGDTPAIQRVFWCVLLASVAAILLVAGGLGGLQAATLASALPFTVIMLLLCVGLLRGMSADLAGRDIMQTRGSVPSAASGVATPWRRRLGHLLRAPQPGDIERFITDTVTPALQVVAAEFVSNGVEAQVQTEPGRTSLTVPSEGTRNFVYGVEVSSHPVPGFGMGALGGTGTVRQMAHTATTYFSDGRRGYDVMGFTRDDIISDTLKQFEIYRALMESPSTSLYFTSPDEASRPDRSS